MYVATASIEDKYEAVKNLIRRGATQGERDAATLAKRRLEHSHPYLRAGSPLAHYLEERGFEQDLRSPSGNVYSRAAGNCQLVVSIGEEGWRWTVQTRPRVPGADRIDGWFGLDLRKAVEKTQRAIERYHEAFKNRR